VKQSLIALYGGASLAIWITFFFGRFNLTLTEGMNQLLCLLTISGVTCLINQFTPGLKTSLTGPLNFSDGIVPSWPWQRP
jgi:hypothetical protein